ncbi:MAG: ferredoxin--NADP reductase [Candidatus Saccharimonadales bacterium]|jgi:ferredoxin-NADP reductase
MKATFSYAEIVAPNIVTYWFQPERPMRFDPGQFVEIYMPHDSVDNRGHWREFSLSSSPNEELIAITTNFFSHGSTYKQALKSLTPGTVVTMKEPMGDFVLPKDCTIPLVFVAAGLGIAPYASIIKWLLERGEQRDIQLIYSVSSPSEFLFYDLWKQYDLNFVPLVTRPDNAWKGHAGHLNVDRLLALMRPLERSLIYLAGPQSFIEPFYNELLAAGIPRSQLLLDYFPGY